MEVVIRPPGRKEVVFKPTMISVIPNHQMQWLGRLGMPRLFDGEHTMRVEPIGTDLSKFVQEERFHGLLVPFLGGMLSATQRGFEEMNEALKARAEKSESIAYE